MTAMRKKRDYFLDLHKELIAKCQKKDNWEYKSCEEAAKYHYRRCMTDQFEDWECEENIYDSLLTYCSSADSTKTPFCMKLKTTTPGTSTSTHSTTTVTEGFFLLTKKSNIITVGAIGGIVLCFILSLLTFCCIRRRIARKKAEKEAAWNIPGWSSGTTSETGSKASTAETGSAWDIGWNGGTETSGKSKKDKKTTKIETAKLPTEGKGKSSKKEKKKASAPPVAATPIAKNPTEAPHTPNAAPPTPNAAPTPTMPFWSSTPSPVSAGPSPISPMAFWSSTPASPAPSTPKAPALGPAPTPAPTAAASNFMSFPAWIGSFGTGTEVPKPSQAAQPPKATPPKASPAPAPSTPGGDDPTGNTATMKPLYWNKQAKANTYD